MSRFLPKSPQDYALSSPRNGQFTGAPAKLLLDIGRKMAVSKGATEGRIPSPFSRAYMFYLMLFARGLAAATDQPASDDDLQIDAGRQLLRAEARRTFRGLCATFALREVFDLDIRLEAIPVTQGAPLEEALLPAIDAAPRGRTYWNPVRFYTVRYRRQPREILAGVSPLTGLFPPATHPGYLRCLYWYDVAKVTSDDVEYFQGTWYDPTSDDLGSSSRQGEGDFKVSAQTTRKMRDLMRLWLVPVITALDQPGALEAFGVTEYHRTLLLDEFKAWQGELGAGASPGNTVRTDRPVAGPEPPPPGVAPLPFLNPVCVADPRYLLSDLPMYKGRLLVTRDELLSRSKRLYGREFGNGMYQAAVDRMPARGDNLGVALGLEPEVIPIGYVFVDRLFTRRLTFLTDRGFSKEWRGLEFDGQQYLLPFKPEILDLISPRELAQNTRGELAENGQDYIVRLRFGSAEITQVYSDRGEGNYIADSKTILPDTFDLRLFPSFDLDALADTLPPEDRRYYARVRLAPDWDFKIGTFHYDPDTGSVAIDGRTAQHEGDGAPSAGGTPTVSFARVGEADELPRDGHYAVGETLFITCEKRPSGFYLENQGLCLVDLRRPGAAQTAWEVGIDFGTSNTCVTYRRPSDPKPRVMELPVLTTTLLQNPVYEVKFAGERSTVSEGASAVLDFFTKQKAEEIDLKDQPYFPTQFVTLEEEPRERPSWEFANGLIYFRNVSLEDQGIWALIDRYPSRGTGPLRQQQRFRLKRDIKWKNTRWLEAYMRHLRKQVLMTAAFNNAAVGTLHFSYPKAFNIQEKDNFRSVLRLVWADGQDGFKLISESEAVRNYSVKETSSYVIFDVGGGTTEILGFNRRSPVFQTSFQLAARQINQYVIESVAFRKAFLRATHLAIGGDASVRELRGFPEETFLVEPRTQGYDPEVIETIWLGLLEIIERRDTPDNALLSDILNYLRSDSDATQGEAAQRAVRGFFLSIALLFGGLGYYAGILMRAAAEGLFSNSGKTFAISFPHLLLTGNGSKLYRMVDHRERKFDRVVGELLRRGLLADGYDAVFDIQADDITFEGIYKDLVTGAEAPKLTVALGLLTPPRPGSSDDQIPVANVTGESGYVSGRPGDAPTAVETDLLRFYEAVSAHQQAFRAPQEPPERLRSFMEAMNEVLPKGNNRSVPVLPGIGQDWHKSLLGTLYRQSTRQIETRLLNNAKAAAASLDQVDDEDMPALEPLFIVELAALLDRIREAYSK